MSVGGGEHQEQAQCLPGFGRDVPQCRSIRFLSGHKKHRLDNLGGRSHEDSDLHPMVLLFTANSIQNSVI